MLSHNETVKYFLPGILYLVKALASNNATASVVFICSVWSAGSKYSLWVVQRCSVKSFVYMWVAYHQLYLLIHSLAVHTHPNPKSCAKGQSSGPARRTPKTHHTDQDNAWEAKQGKGKRREGKGREPESQVRKNQQFPPHPGPISLHI